MSIATRTGDGGTTGLLYGQRVPKDHPQIEAVGAYDGLNVEIGAAALAAADAPTREILRAIQGTLIAVMGELACAEEDAARYAESTYARLQAADLEKLDALIAGLEARGLTFHHWATPGTNAASLALERARIAARAAERRLAALPAAGRHPRPLVPQWTNRLADLLWLLARAAETP